MKDEQLEICSSWITTATTTTMTGAKESPAEETTPLLAKHHNTLHGSEQAPSIPVPTASSSRVTTDDLDARLKRWLDYIARRNPKKAKMVSALERDPQFLFSVFEKRAEESFRQSKQEEARWEGFIDEKSFVK
jgi:hypothetical protein